jgi:hypothetical protein
MNRLWPLLVLVATVAACSGFLVAPIAVGRVPSDNVLYLNSFGLTLAFILWVIADARTAGRTPCYDFGFLVGIFFPVSLVWYVLWSRGWRGLLTLATLVGLMLLPSVSYMVAWAVRFGSA